jgi:ABC-type oligopeptide transport system ATPase subunit
VEMGTADQIFANPQHWYTRALLKARPLLRANNMGGFELAAD